MEWEQFRRKYSELTGEYNSQSFEERCRVSRFGQYEAIAELIRSKIYLKECMDRIDQRIATLSKFLDQDLIANYDKGRNLE